MVYESQMIALNQPNTSSEFYMIFSAENKRMKIIKRGRTTSLSQDANTTFHGIIPDEPIRLWSRHATRTQILRPLV